ncbi:MAG: hypothetical protein PVSMB7_07810 [Chloroflexota bacterium]
MTTMPLRVLLVLRRGSDGASLIGALRDGGYAATVEFANTPSALQRALDNSSWDLVLAASGVAGLSWESVLSCVRASCQETAVIVVARAGEEQAAAGFMRRGAYDYVLERHLHRLAVAVDRALESREARRIQHHAEVALRQSSDRFIELIENANDVVFTTDLNGNFTSLNKAGESISGYTRDELCMMNMAQVLAPDSLILAQEMLRQKLVDNRPTVYQLDLIARDGHRVPLEVSTRLICHGEDPVAIQGIARDITERKRAAEALRESEERYRGLFENASDIVYTHDLEGRFTSVNQAVEKVTGFAREEILRMSIADILAPGRLAQAQDMIRHKLYGEGPTTYETEIVTKDGHYRLLEINTQLIFSARKAIGVQGIARDVTERRRAEEQLRARAGQQAAVAELGQAALASMNPQRLFIDAVNCINGTLNVEYCALLEFVPEDSTLRPRAGAGWRDGLSKDSVRIGRDSLSGYALTVEEPLIVEDILHDCRFSVPAVLLDHKVRSTVSVRVHGIERPFGVLSAYSVHPRSFTRDDVHFLQSVANILATSIGRNHLEEERAHHNKELATRVLQAQEEERKRIARELHDETAQSLSMLLTHLDLLEPHVPRDHAELRAGFERVGELARRTLDETRALSHDLRPTILDDAGLTAALHWLGAEYEETFGLSVHVDDRSRNPRPLSPEIEVALFRIAQEALTNSGKHAEAGMATISLDVGATEARLVVKDDGRGFDPAKVAKPTRAGRLGLYGMHERAALLGGTLEIASNAGSGTMLEVTIPLAIGTTTGEDM